MSALTEEAALELLRDKGYRVTPPPPQPPPRRCAVCKVSEEDEYLTDFRVTVAAGEEGFSDVRRFFCEVHMIPVIDSLMEMGFESHHHGSTTFLANEDHPPCGGYGRCMLYDGLDSTPEEYR
jgi:hypothetical protein